MRVGENEDRPVMVLLLVELFPVVCRLKCGSDCSSTSASIF